MQSTSTVIKFAFTFYKEFDVLKIGIKKHSAQCKFCFGKILIVMGELGTTSSFVRLVQQTVFTKPGKIIYS